MEFIGSLIVILLTTSLLGQIFVRLNLPAVIGQLLAGIILGPALLGFIKPGETIDLFAELGVILLMFLAGIESDLGLLKKFFKPSMTVALLGVLFPVVFIGIATSLFGMNLLESLFIGIVFAATSVSISVEVLKDFDEMSSKSGTTILGAAVVDDILAVIVLSLFTTFSHEGSSGPTDSLLFNTILEITYFIVVWFIFKFVAPYVMRWAERLELDFSVVIASLILAFGMAFAADLVGLSAVVGAFFGGLAIRQTPQFKEVQNAVSAIGYSVFIPVFFTSIGLSMTFTGIGKNIWLIVLLSVLALLTKFYGGTIGAQLFKFSKRDANVVGSGMISRGEMALIIAQIGIGAHLFPQSVYSSVIIVIILTTLLSPFIMNYFIKKEA
ncbi:kef-type K+ transport system [Amylolactobacillus amylotrophicus DSM 20534]|uniref:Kef-type K+ transport system n=3 Tax=Amylolactobacillus TaxID=2767876 RepID=A0A0R1YM70_9LACO|nr:MULTISPECIES: cation:proton antiporter [Amylolactobacillus]APT18529.1 sodium:proton antiporter [Amylolactobacillus amylophilus DSM 20533 = JCM 1125]KRK37592.1 kef-type K+ transport system [Amylolactobacillus amylotrophicus DSM 20534]KRM43568.1 kef-type K+ transport system [Amylolactobacillus amylophilus DSM 20533 = JCM 1125]GED80341.1 sodium:proton antiporter [Amylolactobacillus amylophilus]